MKVLFVSSGNSLNFDIAPFIKSQGESLKALGVEVQYFPIRGRGLSGYLKEAFRLRKYLKDNSVDVIHAHYVLSGWTTVLSFPRQPIVLSLMGSDAYGDYVGVNKITFFSRYLILLTYLIQPFVRAIISKSENIEHFVFFKRKSHIIPNGITLDKIKFQKNGFRDKLGLKPGKKYVLFLGDKKNKRKNFELIEKAFNLINSDDVSLIAPYPVPHDSVVKYLNSVNVIVVPSFMEGSPNVVKEAMACNCPIVATDVGDVKWLFGNVPGHFLTRFDPADAADKIRKALAFSENVGRTKGRERVLALGLSSETVAGRVVSVYEDALRG